MNPMKWLTREKALWLAGIFIFLGLATDWFGFVGTTWKEEVRLHDGSLLVVERSFHLKGRHEIGQSPPIGEQSIAFNLPGTDKAIVWKDEYSKELGRANFVLVALHIFNGVPYLITTANGCLSSNKWGRPNPPYVIFKYKEKKWERIGLNDLPSELTTVNLVISPKNKESDLRGYSPISADQVMFLNRYVTSQEYKLITRDRLVDEDRLCPEMIPSGSGGWVGIGWFERQQTLDRCVSYCKKENINSQYCPCERLFKDK